MISPKAREALLAAHDLHRASAAVLDVADAGPDVINEAMYAELRRLADRLDTLSTVIAEEAGL